MNTNLAEREQEYGIPYGADAVNADLDYINSERFAGKFKNITGNEAVNKTLLECSRKAIEHRSGTLYEDMYLINGNTGEIISQQTNALKEQRINYTGEMLKSIEMANSEKIPIIALHTHPEGYPPSVDDFNSVYEHEYFLGVVVGHNGQVYKFQNNYMYIDDPVIVQSDIAFAYRGGIDIDRSYRETFLAYGLNYEIVKE